MLNAFEGLSLEGLPEGPKDAPHSPISEKPVPIKKRKKGNIHLRKEKAHRGGKTVIVVDGFSTHISVSEIEDLGQRLKKVCGCGGTRRNRTFEIQGDQPARIRELLQVEGFKVGGVT